MVRDVDRARAVLGEHASEFAEPIRLQVMSAPVITVIGTNFGAVLTETVFSWPGLGRYMVTAVLDRDLYVVQNVLLLVILLVIAGVFVADFIVHLINSMATRESEAAPL